MKMNKPSVTIGIPAYNEEKNIGFLLKQLLNQKFEGFKLEKIIVTSDNSKDKTVETAEKLRNPLIQVVNNKNRIGVAGRENQLFELSNSDIFVLLNADIYIQERDFISKLIHPLIKGEADLTSPRVKPYTPKKIIEKILAAGFVIKDFVFREIEKGDNIYFCHGAARAFSKKFYKKIKFKESVGEDAYVYLLCKQRGFKFKLAATECYIKLPETISDHQKQSIRFLQSQSKFYKEFGEEFVKQQYGSSSMFFGINPILVLKGMVCGFLKNPAYTILYLILSAWIRIKGIFYKEISSTWEISSTSKDLHLADFPVAKKGKI